VTGTTVSRRGSFIKADERATTAFFLAFEDTFPFKELTTMLQLAIACLVIALIAAVLGFGGVAGSFVGVAKILFIVFLVLAVLTFFMGRRSGGLVN